MRIGVVSDTHGNVGRTEAAVLALREAEVERVLHCGDIGAPEIIPLFAPWPTEFVFGNCDYERAALAAAIAAAGQTCRGEFGELELDGRRIAFLHSDDGRRFQATLAGGGFDLVCYGHTHVAATDWHGATLALNPGALHRAHPPSLAVVSLPDLHVEFIDLG